MRRSIYMSLLLLAGCASASSLNDAMQNLNERYQGRKLEEFTASYGAPVRVDDRNYRWISLAPGRPSTAPAIPAVSHGQLVFAQPSVVPQPKLCQLHIHLDARKRIDELAVERDAEGEFSNSLCAEIFRPN